VDILIVNIFPTIVTNFRLYVGIHLGYNPAEKLAINSLGARVAS